MSTYETDEKFTRVDARWLRCIHDAFISKNSSVNKNPLRLKNVEFLGDSGYGIELQTMPRPRSTSLKHLNRLEGELA